MTIKKPSIKETPGVVTPKMDLHFAQSIALLKPGSHDGSELDIRCIYLDGSGVAFGIIFLETEDSFLVGASAKLAMDEDRNISPLPLGPMSVMRIFKSTITMMSGPSPLYKYHYMKYLVSERGGKKLLPDFIKGLVLEELLEYTTKYEFENSVVHGSATAKITPETVAQGYARQGITGMSEEAFVPFKQSKKVH